MSPSVFSGRRRVTTHEHNPQGLVVRSVMEPEWTAEDREQAYALLSFEADLCRGCGQPLKETSDPANEDAYVPQLPIRCWRCTALEQASERYQNSPQPSALTTLVLHRSQIPEPSPVPGEGVPARESPSPLNQL